MIPNNRLSPRIFITVGLSIFVFVSFLLYASVDTNAKLRQDIYSDSESANIAQLKQRIEILEKQLQKNNEVISGLDRRLADEANKQNVGQDVKQVAEPPGGEIPDFVDQNNQVNELSDEKHQVPEPADPKLPNHQEQEVGVGVGRKPVTFKTPSSSGGQCAAKSAKSDVQMLDAYIQMPFDNPDGGVWKQGFDIRYDKQKIKEEKTLEVVVIPHSHCDPGWLRTFEEYYDQQTQHILNGMLKHLDIKPDLKFIYAEMSFFELWWSRLTDAEREKTRSYLRSGQLEIVTGGWVMTDEANARSFAIVMELIEGHEFLRNQLQYKPQSHWSIDPFGLSATLAQLVKASNLTHMAVQRVHYSVKKYLAETKQLEFRWRQLYAGEDTKTDIRTHMFPFYSYDVPHTCGPDPSICCQFDFRRLTSIGCPWGKRPQRITDRNVAARAEILADQYRKKAQLYKMNTLLVPLGDDFRYDSDMEWEDQYTNYKQLFDYMNNKKELNIHARFGTLKNYFDLLDKRLAEQSQTSGQNDLPILSGDFFTYADRDDHYWSGYFTSRPFYKHMDRTVQHYIRTADILHSLALWKAKAAGGTDSPLPAHYYDLLVQSRRSLSLFQHHDGVTGTGRDHVVLDYGKKMIAAIDNSSLIIGNTAAYLLGIQDPKETELLKPDLEYFLEELPKQLKVEAGSSILLYNSLAVERREIVCLRVASAKSRIQREGADPKQQIQPRVQFQKGQFQVHEDEFDLCFEVVVPALGFERYSLVEGADSEHMVKIQLSAGVDKKLFPDATVLSSTDSVSISNQQLTAKFDSSTGYLNYVQYAKEKESAVQMEFVHYGARQRKPTGSDSMSGAYLFLPDGPAKPLTGTNNAFVVVKGDVRQSVLLRGPHDALVYQQINLDVNARSLEIVTRVDVRSTSNFELSMRVKAKDFKENEQFYTDLNGFQMIRRKRFDKLPLQANFYPMTTAAFIDSGNRRLTLLGRQSLGVASLEAGQLEVILDRRLLQDDDRGLAQGVLDNKQTESRFRLLLEKRRPQSSGEESNRAGFLSNVAVRLNNELNYPLTVLHGHFDSTTLNAIPRSWTPLKKPFPCDTHLFALRSSSEPTNYTEKGERSTKPRFEASLILERQGLECLIEGAGIEDCGQDTTGKFQLGDYFALSSTSVKGTSLTGMYEEKETLAELHLSPMELRAVKVEF